MGNWPRAPTRPVMAETGRRQTEAVVDLSALAVEGVEPVHGVLLAAGRRAARRGVGVRPALLALAPAHLHLHGLAKLGLVHDEEEGALHIPCLLWVGCASLHLELNE